MENLFFLTNGTTDSNHTWSLLDPPRLFICHGAPPYGGLEPSSALLFLTGVLLFLLSVGVVIKRWRHYVALRRHRLLTVQAAARGTYPATVRTVIVRGDPRFKYATQVSGVDSATWNGQGMAVGVPSAGLEFMPETKLPPYVEYPPPPYEDSERRNGVEHV